MIGGAAHLDWREHSDADALRASIAEDLAAESDEGGF
jgi:hypothetical protein